MHATVRRHAVTSVGVRNHEVLKVCEKNTLTAAIPQALVLVHGAAVCMT